MEWQTSTALLWNLLPILLLQEDSRKNVFMSSRGVTEHFCLSKFSDVFVFLSEKVKGDKFSFQNTLFKIINKILAINQKFDFSYPFNALSKYVVNIVMFVLKIQCMCVLRHCFFLSFIVKMSDTLPEMLKSYEKLLHKVRLFMSALIFI